jgi:hypothetical protein
MMFLQFRGSFLLFLRQAVSCRFCVRRFPAVSASGGFLPFLRQVVSCSSASGGFLPFLRLPVFLR